MHGLSKPLQNAWERAFGKNGIQEVTMIQFLYCCWGVQDKLGENFKMYWNTFSEEMWEGTLLLKPLLTRWGYPLDTAIAIYGEITGWIIFLARLYEVLPSGSLVCTYAKSALVIIKNDIAVCHLCFIVTFGKYYWLPNFRWMMRTDKKTKLFGHSSHEMPLQVFLMLQGLDEIIEKWNASTWEPFVDFRERMRVLPDDVLGEDGKLIVPGRQMLEKQVNRFFLEYRKTFISESGFSRWMKSLLVFTLASANTRATTIFAKYIVSPEVDQNIPNDEESDDHSVHTKFKYSKWLDHIKSPLCEVNHNDRILEKHKAALQELASGNCLWADDASEDMQMLQLDCNRVILNGRHHNQSTEAAVNEISQAAQNQKNEDVASAIVAGRSRDIYLVSVEVKRHLENTDLAGNQHMSGGTNVSGMRELKSEESRRRSAERIEIGSEYTSRPQATALRAKLVIDQAFKDPFDPSVYKTMKAQVKNIADCTNGRENSKSIRARQKEGQLDLYIQKYEQRKASGDTRLKNALNLQASLVSLPPALRGVLKIKNFRYNTHRPAIRKELESRGATREQLDSIAALAGFKELLRVLVGAPDFNADIEVLHEDHDAQSILDTVA